MISYKDRWFCSQNTCKKWNVCDRALTDEVYKAADKWWGEEGAPIAIRQGIPEECIK